MKSVAGYCWILMLGLLVSGCQSNNVASTRAGNPIRVVPMSIVNTTDNTFIENGTWRSATGSMSTQRGGLACDNVVSDMRYHQGEFKYWHIAPSDSLTGFGMKHCAKRGDGEPSCTENWGLCGRKVRVTCLDKQYCGQAGELSLAAQINERNFPSNNYIPRVFVDELTQKLGTRPKVPDSLVLYITDFCPSRHSQNAKKNQCQRPQVDISTPAFLLFGKTDEQGYINTNVKVSVELLDVNDNTPAGPQYR